MLVVGIESLRLALYLDSRHLQVLLCVPECSAEEGKARRGQRRAGAGGEGAASHQTKDGRGEYSILFAVGGTCLRLPKFTHGFINRRTILWIQWEFQSIGPYFFLFFFRNFAEILKKIIQVLSFIALVG